MINISKEDTLRLIWINKKTSNKKHKITTSYPSKCLNCLEDIFISYRQFNILNIYCDNCKNCGNNKSPNIKLVQAQYMRRIKENQLSLINKYLKFDDF